MSNNKKKKNSGIAGLALLFGWLLFALLAVIFYFYFMDKLPFIPGNSGADNGAEVSKQTEPYETKYIYQTNANPEINALVTDYYNALAVCSREELQALVTNPSAFDDMTEYLKKAGAITGYSNINCYTLPGYTEDATLVYAVCNVTIKNVSSTPLDIKQLYVRKTDAGYKIDNGTQDDAEITAYINEQSKNEDIQALYKTVLDDNNQCIAEDSAFAEFYNNLYPSGQ